MFTASSMPARASGPVPYTSPSFLSIGPSVSNISTSPVECVKNIKNTQLGVSLQTS